MDEPRYEHIRDQIEVPWDDLRAERGLQSLLNQAQATVPATPLETRSRAPWLAAAALLLVGATVATTWALTHVDAASGQGVDDRASLAQAQHAPPSQAGLAASSAQGTRVAKASHDSEHPEHAPPLLEGEQAVSLLAFAEGAQARLSEHASVRLVEEAGSEVDLAQERGLVHYQVHAEDGAVNEERVIQVAHLFIIVQAGEFSAQINDTRLELQVSEGSVRVEDGERSLNLVSGDALELEARAPRPWPTAVEHAQGHGPRGKSGQPSKAKRPAASNESLLAQADAARARGDLAQSARKLSELLKRDDGAPPVAWISLGRVEARRGRHVQAARAFERYWKQHPSRPLAEDALYQACMSWKAAGKHAAAARAAEDYLRAFPAGLHAQQVAAYVQ